jgi:AraC-like DNA-binding protein
VIREETMKSKTPAFPARLPAGIRLGALAEPFAAPSPDDPTDEPVIEFTPVPRRRNRRSGWTEGRQRGFIAALARCGCVKAAARHVGLSARTVYRLLDMEGAESFAAAWDQAMDLGLARVRADALERSLNGAFVPVYRRGKLVRVEYRRCDKLAMALLGGRDRQIADSGRAVRRMRLAADFRALHERRATEERERIAAEERYQAQLEAVIERGRAAHRPRVRSL